MPRLSLVAVLVCAMGVLAACQGTGLTAPSGPVEAGVTANAVTGDAIEVTALDPPVAPTAPSPSAASGNGTAAPQAAPAAEPAATEPAATPAPKADLAATPVTPKSEMQLACEKKDGVWYKIGEGDKRACVRRTRDAAKRCDRESQCEGVCLARSGTCSPFKPMYGCNEILQDNGARVTLCLE
jgi:hypothetical protein